MAFWQHVTEMPLFELQLQKISYSSKKAGKGIQSKQE